MDGVKIEPGERVIFRSSRGGPAGHSGWIWLLILFGGSQVCGALMMIPIVFKDDSGGGLGPMIATSVVTLIAGGAALVRWIMMKVTPAYVITDRRLIARRIFWTPVVIELENVRSAARVLVQYQRYGRVVSEVLTHRVGVSFRTGGFRRFGPIKEADEFATLLQGVAQGVVDCKALPDADGGLPAAETRTDIFFVRGTTTGGAPRGPLFVGPTKVIGFAEPFYAMLLNQVLTIAGAPKAKEDVEASMLSLAQSDSFGRGRSVIMEREGLTLSVEGNRFQLGSADHLVAFDLTPSDAERAKSYVKSTQSRGYR